MNASLQSAFATNYEFRCSLLTFSEPTDIILLISALGPSESLTWEERKKHLPLFTLLFKNDGAIVDLCKRSIKVTVICKYMDELKEIYNEKATRKVHGFEVLLVLSKSHRVIPIPPDLMKEIFGVPRTPIDSIGTSDWCETSANLDGIGINVRFMRNAWDTIIPFWQPLIVAKRFMFIKDDTRIEDAGATLKYMHLHKTMTTHRTATTLAGGKRYYWSNNVAFGFTIHMGYRLHAHVPIFI